LWDGRNLSSKYIEDMLNIPVGEGCELVLAPITVSKSDSATIVVEKMIKENIGAVIVVENDKPVGIITEKDMLAKVIRPRNDMHLTLAEDIMSKPIISIEFDRSMKEALELMRENEIRRLVVTNEEAFWGLITERRLLELAFLVT